MFNSFFPKPRLFLISIIVFAIAACALWYLFDIQFGDRLGFFRDPGDDHPIVGLSFFATPQFLWFYGYCGLCAAAFSAFWFLWSPNKWQWWSIPGSMLIVFTVYFNVQVSVALNNWRRPFWDAIQDALSGHSKTTAGDIYSLLLIFAEIAFVWMVVYVLTKFFVSHYIFRWRTAMNDYYMARWSDIRGIEGAAQRVQEDTMRFATIVEDLGSSVVDSVLSLIAFLPILLALSHHVAMLPIVGKIPYPLVVASIFWSLFGTVLLAGAGIKLPGLTFLNQRVEAAYRKELVYGEDNPGRCQPTTVSDLFSQVKRNYFRLYFHYAYFNIFRGLYIQADAIFVIVILIPTIAAGLITFGILQQILSAFGQVSGSFQFLVNSWTTIIELLSIHKRLMAFEAAFTGTKLPEIDRNYVPVPAPAE